MDQPFLAPLLGLPLVQLKSVIVLKCYFPGQCNSNTSSILLFVSKIWLQTQSRKSLGIADLSSISLFNQFQAFSAQVTIRKVCDLPALKEFICVIFAFLIVINSMRSVWLLMMKLILDVGSSFPVCLGRYRPLESYISALRQGFDMSQFVIIST